VKADCIGAKSLRSKLAELQKSRKLVAEGFELGSLLHIRGNVTTYNGQREVKASQFGESPLVAIFITTRTTLVMDVIVNNVVVLVVVVLYCLVLSSNLP